MRGRALTQEIFDKKSMPDQDKFEVYIDERLVIPIIMDAANKLVRKKNGYEKINTNILGHILGVSRKF